MIWIIVVLFHWVKTVDSFVLLPPTVIPPPTTTPTTPTAGVFGGSIKYGAGLYQQEYHRSSLLVVRGKYASILVVIPFDTYVQ